MWRWYDKRKCSWDHAENLIAAKKKRILYVLVKENIVQLFKLSYILRLLYCAWNAPGKIIKKLSLNKRRTKNKTTQSNHFRQCCFSLEQKWGSVRLTKEELLNCGRIVKANRLRKALSYISPREASQTNWDYLTSQRAKNRLVDFVLSESPAFTLLSQFFNFFTKKYSCNIIHGHFVPYYNAPVSF